MILYKVVQVVDLHGGKKRFQSISLERYAIGVEYKIGEEVEAPFGYLFFYKDENKALDWIKTRLAIEMNPPREFAVLKCQSLTRPHVLGYVLNLRSLSAYPTKSTAPNYWRVSSKKRSSFVQCLTPPGTYVAKRVKVLEVIA